MYHPPHLDEFWPNEPESCDSYFVLSSRNVVVMWNNKTPDDLSDLLSH